MQISFALTTLAVLLCTALPGNVVVGEIAHVAIFNGNVPVPELFCNETEWVSIRNAIIQGASSPVRRLSEKGTPSLKGEAAAAEHHGSKVHRRTQTCTHCGPYCGAGGTGCPGGKGGRRRRVVQKRVRKAAQTTVVNSNNGNRKLLTQLECEAKIPAVGVALDALQASSSLSPTCSALLASSRDITCSEFTTDCDITSVSLVNAATNAVMYTLPPTGTTFCNSTKVNFLAATEFFLGTVNFYLTGPTIVANNRTDSHEPYYMYSRRGLPLGRYFPSGDYTLTVTSVYDAARSKTINFRANHC
jgi:hypothetical protein